MKKHVYNILDYYKAKAFQYLGIIPTGTNPNVTAQNEMYINNVNDIVDNLLREYNAWYEGDGDQLLNFYTGNMLYSYQTEPLFDRNKRSYFWSVSATEDDIKRTHSGQPRNIVDTITNIVGLPKISTDEKDANLDEILKDNDFENMFQQEILPYTLVEGWGAYKIDYDEALRDTPILLYYRANEVDFIYNSNQLIAIIYKNYYTDEDKNNYVLFEVRRSERSKDEADGKWHTNLIIEKELYALGDNNTLTAKKLDDLPQLKDVEPCIKISDYKGFLGGPCIIYRSDDGVTYGRSIFKGKISLFDDLDQCLSQSANTVRRSTTHVYINNQYLERDEKTGMPIMPSAYDCKYVMLTGALGADGNAGGGNEPVTTIQPKVDFSQYSTAAKDILVQIVSGIMSPATLGIDLAKKDNAEAQREKEKVTIFTTHTIVKACKPLCERICNELLCAQELMDRNAISKHGYDISVVFDEYADESFENKAETLLTLYNAKVLPPKMFVEQLFSGRSKAEREEIVNYIEEQNAMNTGAVPNGGDPAVQAMYGMQGADNPYNTATEQVDTAAIKEAMGVPDIVGSAANKRGV